MTDSDMLRQINARVDDNTFHIRVDNDSSSYWIEGNIEGNRIAIESLRPVWDNEYGFEGGMLGLNVTGNLTDEGRTVTGEAEWTWEGENEPSCSGTIQFKAAHLEDPNE